MRHTLYPSPFVPGSMSLADWLHPIVGQAVASIPNIDVICSDLLWKSKLGIVGFMLEAVLLH